MTANNRVPRFLQVVLLLAGSLFSTAVVTAADHPAFEPVKRLFTAMSAQDGKAMRETAVLDFQLLEHGEEWTMQKLVDVVLANGEPRERKNFFKQIRARQSGNMAWVSYWNKAEIHLAAKVRTIVWLESAVMVKVDEQWKIQMLHSTRVEPNKHPENIQWDAHEVPK